MSRNGKRANGLRLSSVINCLQNIEIILAFLVRQNKQSCTSVKYRVIKGVEMEIDLLIDIFCSSLLNMNKFQRQSGGGDPGNLFKFAKQQLLTWNLS